MSSIFLEPVSLGNYCVIIFAYALASFRELTIMQRIILLGGTLALMIGCDGRLAAVSCAVIAIAALIAPRLPQRALIAVPFVVLVAGAAAVAFLGLKAGEDDFAGRLAHTFSLLASYGPAEYLGISNLYLPQAVDSGLAYLISTQSVFGVILLWLFVAGFAEERSRQQVVYKTGVAFYLALSMLVSFSFLSIKTASLAWFILGAMQAGALAPLRPPLPVRYWRVPIPAQPEGGRIG
jgi:putative polymerase